MPTLRLKLSEAEIEKLSYECFCYDSMMVRRRIFAVYLNGTTSCSNPQIAQIVGLCPSSVRHWIKVYGQAGFEGLLTNGYCGAKSTLEEHREGILASFGEQPPYCSAEAAERIEAICGIRRSTEQVRAFMKRHGMRFLKCGHVPAKADTEAQKRWVDEQLQPLIAAAKEGKVHLLFLDAVHFMLQPFLCCLWCAARLFVRAASGRIRINVLGAVEAVSKKVVTMTNTTYINAEVLISFLKLLKKKFTGKPVIIVLDNARYQHCRLVMDAAQALGIRLLFLPPYSPNLNIIERLWKFAKKKILYGRYYEKPKQFHQAIETFFENLNKKYKPDLNSLLTLNFQSFNYKKLQICPL